MYPKKVNNTKQWVGRKKRRQNEIGSIRCTIYFSADWIQHFILRSPPDNPTCIFIRYSGKSKVLLFYLTKCEAMSTDL